MTDQTVVVHQARPVPPFVQSFSLVPDCPSPCLVAFTPRQFSKTLSRLVAYDPYGLALGLSVVLGTCMAYLRNVLLAVLKHEFTDPADLVAAFLNLHAQVEKAASVCACTALETGDILLCSHTFSCDDSGRIFFHVS